MEFLGHLLFGAFRREVGILELRGARYAYARHGFVGPGVHSEFSTRPEAISRAQCLEGPALDLIPDEFDGRQL